MPAALALPAGARAAPAAPAAAPKVLRVANPVAEAGFDPARHSDIYSATFIAHIFDAPYEYDHLARPVKLRLRVAAALPESSADFRVWTVRLQPGVYFADDPAFAGRRRELTAQDYVYSFKRFADPVTRSPNWSTLDEVRIVGLAALRERALDGARPFDYDTEIAGLRALDRYTLQFTLEQPRPRLHELLAMSQTFGAVAREVVEHYGDRIDEHPVGTGPFRIVEWVRSSRIVLERNPNYRTVTWDAEPAPDDAEGQAMLARLRGRRLPLVDRVEVSVIDASQPRWLTFLDGAIDYAAVPLEFVPQAMPGGEVAPNLARRGVRGWRVPVPYTTFSYFNMDDPVVGGMTPPQIALRRAICLALDIEREIRIVYRGLAMPAPSLVPPYCSGYDPQFHTEGADYDPARARALLDLYGWVDRDGDGWRERPDGRPLRLEFATETSALDRQIDELIEKSLHAVGLRVAFKPAQWQENLKAARAGSLMVWFLGSSADRPDGQDALARLYGPEAGDGNLARFKLPAFDAVFRRMSDLPDGPERDALFRQAKRLAAVYAPYKPHLNLLAAIVAHPWLDGYRRPVFWYDVWQRLDIDVAARRAAGR
ncbi:MAG: bicyclomycin resistance protein [Burkholderiales bacterium]|nr:bicyclomycin resistance protein [Burkholderiales bacterium]